jgi:hypothetical protein
MTWFRFVIALSVLSAIACNAHDAPRTPEETCIAACTDRAPRCSDGDCRRGCSLTLDRLIEREQEGVIACVAKATVACDDPLWAKCGTRIGAHADGGPAAPPPSPEDD